jgi:hypothetical protein
VTAATSIDLGINVRELLARATIQLVTSHVERLYTAGRLRPRKGTVAEHVESRFRSWSKFPHYAKALIALDHNHDRYVSTTALARACGKGHRDPVRKCIQTLRAWRLPSYDANGNEVDFRPFKRGREFWDQETLKREGQARIDGGIRMTLAFRPPPNFGDAKNMQDAKLPGIIADLEVFEGSGTIIEADATQAAEQREELRRRRDEITGRINAYLAGPQLALPGTGTDGKK